MVKRTANQTIASEIDKLNEKETAAVVNYISQLLSARLQKQSEQTNDDLIVFLSDKRENRRARQVVEWERVRRQNVQQRAA
jgi:HD superfamily phosphohydrolase YqeK